MVLVVAFCSHLCTRARSWREFAKSRFTHFPSILSVHVDSYETAIASLHHRCCPRKILRLFVRESALWFYNMPRVNFISSSLATTSLIGLIVTRKHVIRVCTTGRRQPVSNAIHGKLLVSQIRWGIGNLVARTENV